MTQKEIWRQLVLRGAALHAEAVERERRDVAPRIPSEELVRIYQAKVIPFEAALQRARRWKR